MYGRGCGCGPGHGRRGRGMRSRGRRRCQRAYQEAGARPRRAGRAGYWRRRAAGTPEGWDVEPLEGDEVAQLRHEVDTLHQKLDVLLERLAASGSQEAL